MKKLLSFILVFLLIVSIGNFGVVIAAVGDIGHWRDSAGSQIPGTTFSGFDFDSEIRNDGIYTKPNASTVQVNEAGDYLIIATLRDQDTSNSRYNPQVRVEQISGTGDVFSSYYTGYSRSNAENTAWTRAVSVVIGASENSQFQVQKRRGNNGITGGSVVNASDIQIVRLSQTNHGIYNIGGTGNSYGGETPNTVDITSIVSESDTNAIEGNISTNTITLKGNNKKYLAAWSVSFEGSNNTRTQRIGHLKYNGVDNLATRSYCYMRDANNRYCGLGSMDIIETSSSNISLSTEVYRGDGVGADQGGADQDGSLATDGNGQIIILEMPDSLEVFRSSDSLGLQDITSAQTLNIARDVNLNSASFSKLSDTQVNIVNPANIFTWANIWTARSNIASTQRQTSYGSISINGVEQSTGRHGNYSRGNQGTTDTFAMSYHPAGIFSTSGAGSVLSINSSPLAGGAGGGGDRTQAGTLGFFALNLDTLVPQSIIETPGGVSNDLGLWLRSNQGTSTTTNGATLATWSDQSPNNLDASAVVAPIYRNNASDNLNFYPTIEFNGTDSYMNNTGLGASSRSMFTVIVPDTTINPSLSGQVPFGVECVDARLNTGTCGLAFGGITLGNFTAALTDEVITYAVGSSAAYRSAQIGGSYPSGNPMMIHTNENSAGNGIDIYESGIKVDNATANTYQFLTNTNYSLGRSTDNGFPFYYGGKIVEVINFSRRVTDNERERIESYLGYKYGTTLGNGTRDYIASDGNTLMWSNSIAGAFTDNIFGIGRDEAQGLRQVESRGIGNDNILTLRATGQGTNTSPSFTAISDMEFFSVSNDSGSNTWTTVGSPANFEILERKWRSQEVGDTGGIDFEFDVNNTNFNVPNLESGTQYYLVYDSNGNGNLADETPVAMTNIGGNIWRASNINMSHNTLFTLATEIEINDTEPVLGVSFSDNTNGSDVQSGQIIQYTLAISNSGIDATGISAIAAIDSDLNAPYGFTYSSCGSVSQSFASSTLTFSNISITSGNTCAITYYTQVDSATPSTATITASVDVSQASEGGNNPDPINLATLDVIACGVNDVTLSFVTDNWGEDVYWSLVPSGNSCGVGQIASGGNPNLNCSSGGSQSAGANDPYPDNTTIAEGPYSLTVGNQYDLYVIDDYGDGNTATAPHVLVSQNSTTTDTYTVTGIGGFFTFTVQQPTACIDTISPELTVNRAPGQASPTTVDSATFQVIFNEPINISTFSSSDISLSGTSGSITSGPTQVSPNNGTTFQFTVTGMTLGDTVSAIIPAGGIEDLAGNLNNASTSIDNQVVYNGDITPPTITGSNFASGALLPGGSHSVIFDYFDVDSGIDTSSASLELFRWNGTSWGSNIASGNIGSPTITLTQATYPTLNLDYGRYRFVFSISDNAGNPASFETIHYIDRPLFSVNQAEINIGNINSFNESFSPTITLTVETVGAAFQVYMHPNTNLTYGSEEISIYNGSHGYGYRGSPLNGGIQVINSLELVGSNGVNINSNGNRNTYNYELQLGAITDALQVAGDYVGSVDFSIVYEY